MINTCLLLCCHLQQLTITHMKSRPTNTLANHNLWQRMCECYSIAEQDQFRQMIADVSSRAEVSNTLVVAYLKGRRIMREIDVLVAMSAFLKGATIEALLDKNCDLRPFKTAADEARVRAVMYRKKAS